MDQSSHFSHHSQHSYSVRSPSIPSPRVYPGYPTPTTGVGHNTSQHHLYPSSMGMNGCGNSAPNFRKAAALMHHQQQQQQQQPTQLYTPQQHRKRISMLSDSYSVHSAAAGGGGVYTANPAIHENVPPMPPIQPCYQTQQQQRCPIVVDDHFRSTSVGGPIQSMQFNPPQSSAQLPTGTSSIPGTFPAASERQKQQHKNTKSTSSWKFWRSTSRRTKKVPLFQGNLILDCPVPTRLLEASARKDSEFNQMRYSAVTCDPDDFMDSQYTLRPCLMKRETELFIVMTMYNEDRELFCRTMHGVMKNIAHLCSRTRSHMWDTEGWKKIVVCIVADGRKKCDPGVLDVLETMGVYQKGVAKNMVNDKPVKAHLYEYTAQLSVDPEMRIKGAEKGIVPAQILFCLKEQNAKKINSHRWFFNAFGRVLQPNVCVLLDVGTRPGNTSIYHIWKTFDLTGNIAGACGEIRVQTKGGVALLNPIVAAQNFEYKMSNILDKPLESVFGYISVLPGAFSAYRYAALQNDCHGNGPLQKYFLGEHGVDAASDIFTANMYLAEDRILCYELLAKKHEKWVLKYVQSAFGETDCPDQLPEFLSQRRRWLNGSFFAAIYSAWHFSKVWSTRHTVCRKILLTIQFGFNFANLLFSWLGMANFYLTCYFITKSLSPANMDPFGHGWGDRIFQTVQYLYFFLFIVSFICSMGNRPQGSKWMFVVSLLAYALIMAYTIFAGIWMMHQSIVQGMSTAGWNQESSFIMIFGILLNRPEFRNIIISMASTYGLYILSSLLYLDPWHMITSFVQYLLLLPTYVNILNVYAFCNTHDVSWGTKGDNALPMDLGVASKATDTEKGIEAVEVELEDGQDMINRHYDEALQNLQTKLDPITQSRPPHMKQDDYYRGFRTRLVLAWIGCNAILVAIVTSGGLKSLVSSEDDTKSVEEYQHQVSLAYTGFILWAVTLMAAFRFFGSVLYVLLSCFQL